MGKSKRSYHRSVRERNAPVSTRDEPYADHRTTSLAETKLLILLYVQLMHKNYYKIVKQLKSLKIIIVAPTCFGLHKPSSGSSQSVLPKVTTLALITYRYLHMQPQYRLQIICERIQHCNFSVAQAESSLMMVYVNRNMLEQLL